LYRRGRRVCATLYANLVVVFLAGLVTALATGLGALPFFFEDLPERRMVWWAVFSSLPQPVGAAVAFAFVRLARRFLPFGFAAGATTYLVLTEFIPEALETGAELPLGGKPQLAGGLAAGVLVVLPLLAV
jgi:ZIP family zinc transporter